jgi:protein gp37
MTMNRTKIDWADMTWNPVTGCYHDCEYCYARKIAKRFADPYVVGYDDTYVLSDKASQHIENPQLQDGHILLAQKNPIFKNIGILKPNGRSYSAYPFGFCPTFHSQRLNDPSHVQKPQNIFVCSMADLFGDWVPERWIFKVLKSCERSPQHRYLFLTKNPKRLCELLNEGNLPSGDNFWWGSTITDHTGKRFQGRFADKTFISIEPIFENLDAGLGSFGSAEWIIVGAETGNRKGRIIPQKAWIDNIVEAASITHIPVFMKESLRSLMGDDFKQEFPWEV